MKIVDESVTFARVGGFPAPEARLAATDSAVFLLLATFVGLEAGVGVTHDARINHAAGRNEKNPRSHQRSKVSFNRSHRGDLISQIKFRTLAVLWWMDAGSKPEWVAGTEVRADSGPDSWSDIVGGSDRRCWSGARCRCRWCWPIRRDKTKLTMNTMTSHSSLGCSLIEKKQ